MGREGRKKQVCFWWLLHIPPIWLEMLHSATLLEPVLMALPSRLTAENLYCLPSTERRRKGRNFSKDIKRASKN